MHEACPCISQQTHKQFPPRKSFFKYRRTKEKTKIYLTTRKIELDEQKQIWTKHETVLTSTNDDVSWNICVAWNMPDESV